jgi:hypothetical protein
MESRVGTVGAGVGAKDIVWSKRWMDDGWILEFFLPTSNKQRNGHFTGKIEIQRDLTMSINIGINGFGRIGR